MWPFRCTTLIVPSLEMRVNVFVGTINAILLPDRQNDCANSCANNNA